jgi:hypothetical protein
MSRDLSSEELKDPFSRAMKRALEPPDVWASRQLWMIRIVAIAGALYSITRFGGMDQPAGVALFVGSAVVLSLCEQLRKLSDRVERLEFDVMVRDLGPGTRPDDPVPAD